MWLYIWIYGEYQFWRRCRGTPLYPCNLCHCISNIQRIVLSIRYLQKPFIKNCLFEKKRTNALRQNKCHLVVKFAWCKQSYRARFMGPTWGPSGAVRSQVGPMLAPWTLLSGMNRSPHLYHYFIWRDHTSHTREDINGNVKLGRVVIEILY